MYFYILKITLKTTYEESLIVLNFQSLTINIEHFISSCKVFEK